MRSPRDLTAIDPLRTLHGRARPDLRRPPTRAVGRSLRHLLRLVAVPGAGHAGLHPAHRAALRLLVPDGRAGHAARRAGTGRGAVGVEIRDRLRGRAHRRRRAPGVRGVGLADGTRRRRRRRRGQRRRRAPLRRPAPRRPGAAAGAPRAAIDERASSSWRRRAARRPGSLTTTSGSPATTGPSSRQLAAGRMADDPTIYACVSSVTDPSQAPAGCENWFLLVNTPPGIRLDGAAEQRRVARRARRGAASTSRPDRLDVETITPADLAARYRSPGGAIYGTSSDGRRAAFLRPGQPWCRGAACTSSAGRATRAADCRSC